MFYAQSTSMVISGQQAASDRPTCLHHIKKQNKKSHSLSPTTERMGWAASDRPTCLHHIKNNKSHSRITGSLEGGVSGGTSGGSQQGLQGREGGILTRGLQRGPCAVERLWGIRRQRHACQELWAVALKSAVKDDAHFRISEHQGDQSGQC